MGCKKSEVQILSPRPVEEIHAKPSYRLDMAVLFMSITKTKSEWLPASVELRDAYTDFMLSRQAMNCTASTLDFDKYTAGKFLEWIERRGITSLDEVTARYVREYIAQLVAGGKKDTTVWDHARAIKTMLFFWHNEGYTSTLIKFELPELAKKRLPVLTAKQLKQV
jgi:site-specific recombinase XerD